MSLGTEEKQNLINTHQVHPTDTGSVEVQVAMLTTRISKLSTSSAEEKAELMDKHLKEILMKLSEKST